MQHLHLPSSPLRAALTNSVKLEHKNLASSFVRDCTVLYRLAVTWALFRTRPKPVWTVEEEGGRVREGGLTFFLSTYIHTIVSQMVKQLINIDTVTAVLTWSKYILVWLAKHRLSTRSVSLIKKVTSYHGFTLYR